VVELTSVAGKTKVKREKTKWRSPWQDMKKNPFLYVMILPAIASWVIFNYIPLGGVVIAFQNFRFDQGILRSEFVGLDNFRFFLGNDRFTNLIWLTVQYNLVFMVTGLIASVGLALLLSEIGSKWFKKISHSFIFLPFFISWVVVSFITFALFAARTGMLPPITEAIFGTRVNFYGTPWLWRFIMPILAIWKGVGSSSIIYLAVITGTDPQLHESARVDGASVWQRMWYVSLPLLRPTIILLTVMGLSGILQGGGEMFFQIVGLNTMLHPTVDVIDSFILRSLVGGGAVPFATNAALGLFQQLVGFILIITVNTTIKFTAPEHAIF